MSTRTVRLTKEWGYLPKGATVEVLGPDHRVQRDGTVTERDEVIGAIPSCKLSGVPRRRFVDEGRFAALVEAGIGVDPKKAKRQPKATTEEDD